MVICVRCVDTISRENAYENRWRRVKGDWHCPKCLAGVPEKDIDKVKEGKKEKRMMTKKNELGSICA